MADVKVPPMLHKMSVSAQKAWYKKNKMEYPGAGGKEGRSAAQAKKDVGEINKKKARVAAIARAAASKKNKELVSSSERVREMGRRRRESGEGLGGGLETNRDIISYVRAGGTIKAGRLGEESMQIDEGKAHDRITAGLKDENRDVRVNAILHPKATPEHISIALKDEHPYVREAAIRHRNATPKHISAALNDDHMIVRKAAIKNRNASSENISAALKNGDIYTRMNAIKHRNVRPEHIAIALKDKDSYVRDAAKKRMKNEEVFTEEESIEEAKQVDHAKTIANSLAATHPNFTVSSFNGDHGRAHVVHHKSDTRNFKNGEQLMGPNIQLQHNHKTNKVHMEMQGDYEHVEDRDEETHHLDKAHEAAHKMFKPAIDLIHKTDKKTTNEEVELDEAQKKLKPSYWRAEWRMGTKSDVDKNNKKIYDRLAKTDPEKAAKFHDNLMKIRKEEIEQNDKMKEKDLPFTPDKKKVRRGPGGPMSQAKWLAKQAMMKKMKEMGMKEEVEQTDEAIRGYIQSEPGNQDGTSIRRPANQAERDQLAKNLIANRKYNVGKKIGRKSGSVRSNAAGMTPSQKISTALRSPDASKEMGPKKFPYMPKNAKITPFLSKEEVEQVEEGDLSIRTLYNKYADHYTSDKGNSAKRADAVGKAITKVHGPKVMKHLEKAVKANLRGDMDQEENHFERARNVGEKSGSDRVGATVGRDRSKFRKEEVESVEEGLLDKAKTVAKNVSGIVNPKTPEEKAKSIQRSAQASFYTSRLKRDDANRKAAGMKPLSGVDRLKVKAAGLKRAAEPYVKAALKGVNEEAEQTDEALLPKQQAVADKLKASELAANKEKAGYKFGKSLRDMKVAAKMKKEEIEAVDEKMNLATTKMGDVIKDFQKSDAPQFKGKSMEKRREMAIAAKLGAEREVKEDVEAVEEKYMGFKKVMAAAKEGGARDPAAVAAAIGRKKYGKEKFQAMAAAGKKANEGLEEDLMQGLHDIGKSLEPIAHTIMGGNTLFQKKKMATSSTPKQKPKVVRDPKTGKLTREALDPVGREDKDIDNDGDSDKTDMYLSKRRKAIGAAIRKKVADKMGK